MRSLNTSPLPLTKVGGQGGQPSTMTPHLPPQQGEPIQCRDAGCHRSTRATGQGWAAGRDESSRVETFRGLGSHEEPR